MTQNENSIKSRKFLNICQKGDEYKLQHFINENNENWTFYRYPVTGDTGLHLAVQNGHINIVNLLIKYRHSPADIDITNLDGKRPLHVAAQFSRHKIVKLLIEQGALINTFKRADWTPLMLACTKSSLEAKACVELLLEANADPFLKNKDGWTALFVACRTGDFNIVNLFLTKFGSQCINDRSHNGRTILHICVFHEHLELIDLLIHQYPILLNTPDSAGYTPLHESVKTQNLQIIKKLVDSGAHVPQIDCSGRTMLHISVLMGYANVTEYFLNTNLIDLKTKDVFGNTAYEIAKNYNMQSIIKLLENYMLEQNM